MLTLRVLFVLLISSFLAASATTVPDDIQKIMQADFADGKYRLDGVFQSGNKLWLPIIPKELPDGLVRNQRLLVNVDDKTTLVGQLDKKSTNEDQEENELSAEAQEKITLIYADDDHDYLFSNGWIYTQINENTIKSLEFYGKVIQEQILKNRIVSEFIVPNGFLLPRDLAIVTGHLPIKFRDVELATHKEERYLELLKKEIKDSNMELITYDFNSGDFKLSIFSLKEERLKSMNKAVSSKDKGLELKSYNIDDLSKEVSLLSQMKRIGDDIFLVDYNKDTVFKLSPNGKSFSLTEWFKLDPGLGLKDFAVSAGGEISYLLTNKEPKLFVYDTIRRKLIKTLDMPSNPDSLLSFSKDARATDYLVVEAKGGNEVVLVSSFDHRIITKLPVGDLPCSMAASDENLFVASKGAKNITVIDWVTQEKVDEIKLDSEPSKILLSPDQNRLYALSSTDANLTIYSFESNDIAKVIDLKPDIIEPKDLAFSPENYFLIVGSSASDSIGIIDTATEELVKKINIKGHSNKLVTGLFSQ